MSGTALPTDVRFRFVASDRTGRPWITLIALRGVHVTGSGSRCKVIAPDVHVLEERIDTHCPRIIDVMANKAEASSLGTVARVALLLKVLAEAGGDMQLARVAGQLNLAASSTHRLLGLLVDCGLAKRGKQPGSYRPGFEFVRLAGLVLAGSDDLIELATDFMKNVVDATEETCVLSVC